MTDHEAWLRADFERRHIGSSAAEQAEMLALLNVATRQELIDQVVPEAIRLAQPPRVADAGSEREILDHLRAYAAQNDPGHSFIGQGYYGTQVPAVIQRNVLENPGWYTAYTPYQAEIAQGRLEALLNFQQMVMDLTGLPLANASLLDEATAAAEAMAMIRRLQRKHKSNRFFVSDSVFSQTRAVLLTRAEWLGIEIVTGPDESAVDYEPFGALLQNPAADGEVRDLTDTVSSLHEQGALVAVATDLLACVQFRSPGSMGADLALGNSQRFGVPMGYGGPHAAFFACREEYRRSLPGRIIGVSRDRHGRPALRMALQTREQHIRREKANSNICTAQVLLANMAGFYAVYHGPDRLRHIAGYVHNLARTLAARLIDSGMSVTHAHYFDTLDIRCDTETVDTIRGRAKDRNCHLFYTDAGVRVSVDETTTRQNLEMLCSVLTGKGQAVDSAAADASAELAKLYRNDAILTHPVFHRHQSETAMLRYITQLERRDMTLTHSMISLGSCTMKLNASAQMMAIGLPGFSEPHPMIPVGKLPGYAALLRDLEQDLCALTGFDAMSLQPNSGAQGEYAGLLAIRRYQQAVGEGHRDICLIPSSAHGTNPASAQMAGLTVRVVRCDAAGNVDMEDLAAQARKAGDRLSCLMITYPSTHGVFEPAIPDACALIHDLGGQVYMDGANLNAQVGLTSPAQVGADVAHLNLHKTFAIPHGGGGPGMGPIGVRSHLADYLPGPPDETGDTGAVSAAPFGSASILPITWAYIRLLGRDGLRSATEAALLHANYLAESLAPDFPVLYRGPSGRVAHECIIDLRPFKQQTGISEVDIAKRLMDYGFHAPTMSFPVPGTLMIEPTESENKAEIDRFIRAMQSIREEIRRVESGVWSSDDNPLVNAPHTMRDVMADEWPHGYSKETAAFPAPEVQDNKFWPSCSRIDEVFGDRNLFCSCIPTSDYASD